MDVVCTSFCFSFFEVIFGALYVFIERSVDRAGNRVGVRSNMQEGGVAFQADGSMANLMCHVLTARPYCAPESCSLQPQVDPEGTAVFSTSGTASFPGCRLVPSSQAVFMIQFSIKRLI